MLDTAQQHFLERGYADTTLPATAREAGVSVETIYKVFGGKAGLVRAIYQRGLEGRGSDRAYDHSDAMRERETDPRTIMRGCGMLTAEVAAEVTPIRLLIRSAAATDRDMAALLQESNDRRLRRMRHHARFLADRDYLRQGVTVAHATDVLWTCSSAELYEQLVLQRRWSQRRYARFVSDIIIASLLDETDHPPSGDG